MGTVILLGFCLWFAYWITGCMADDEIARSEPKDTRSPRYWFS
jgi:hypothetical protein